MAVPTDSPLPARPATRDSTSITAETGTDGLFGQDTPVRLAVIERLCYNSGMVRVHYFRAHIARSLADALNAESGQAYTDALVRHWRVYRCHGHWLSRKAASKLQDAELAKVRRYRAQMF